MIRHMRIAKSLHIPRLFHEHNDGLFTMVNRYYCSLARDLIISDNSQPLRNSQRTRLRLSRAIYVSVMHSHFNRGRSAYDLADDM